MARRRLLPLAREWLAARVSERFEWTLKIDTDRLWLSPLPVTVPRTVTPGVTARPVAGLVTVRAVRSGFRPWVCMPPLEPCRVGAGVSPVSRTVRLVFEPLRRSRHWSQTHASECAGRTGSEKAGRAAPSRSWLPRFRAAVSPLTTSCSGVRLHKQKRQRPTVRPCAQVSTTRVVDDALAVP